MQNPAVPSILVGGNASGDLKLKPLWIHISQTPLCFRRKVKKDKSNLPVYWASNKKAWMTAEVFENWYKNNFLHPVRRWCRRKKIEFKILLLVDNCTGQFLSVIDIPKFELALSWLTYILLFAL